MADSVVNTSSPSDTSLADSPTVVTSGTVLDQSANDQTNRPISTIPADSQNQVSSPLADSPVATVSASITPDQPISADSVPSISIDQSANATSAPTADASASPPETTLTPQPQEEAPVSAPVSQITPEPVSGGSIQDLSSSNEPAQAQSDVQDSTSSSQASGEQKTAPESAEIKTETPQDLQNAPLADSPSAASNPTKSFGDLSSGQNSDQTLNSSKPPLNSSNPSFTPEQATATPPSVTTTPSEAPTTPKASFGDLMGNKISEEPTINIESIQPPKPVQPPLPTEASAKEGQSPLSPQSPQPVIEAKADFSTKRIQALQNRRKKRDDHLVQILNLVSQKSKINNEDVCRLLRVSQSTATNYLRTLVNTGKLKKEGKGKATVYRL